MEGTKVGGFNTGVVGLNFGGKLNPELMEEQLKGTKVGGFDIEVVGFGNTSTLSFPSSSFDGD